MITASLGTKLMGTFLMGGDWSSRGAAPLAKWKSKSKGVTADRLESTCEVYLQESTPETTGDILARMGVGEPSEGDPGFTSPHGKQILQTFAHGN